MPRPTTVTALCYVAILAVAGQADAQTAARWARVSFFTHAATATQADGTTATFSELVATATLQAPMTDSSTYGYGLDLRLTGYPMIEQRGSRTSVYEAFFAKRVADRVDVRVGQLWITELGALGSVGGVLVEGRVRETDAGRFRVGTFAGWEPRILHPGWVNDVAKLGAYLALDGDAARRHVVGFVHLRNKGVTERSVVSLTNYLRGGDRLFLYQAAEIDLLGPAGQGNGGLTYFFANARVSPSRVVELQGTLHRGRSVDARTIVEQVSLGRPIEAKSLEGLRFESIGGRVTVSPGRGVRVYAGYAVDRNNRHDDPTGRLTLGVFAASLFGSGVDLTVTDYRMHRGKESSYDSWYASVGRSVGSRTYLSGEFASSLSVVHVTGLNNFVIESRPRTNRFGVTGLFNVRRHASVVATVERTEDAFANERRVLAGLTYRF